MKNTNFIFLLIAFIQSFSFCQEIQIYEGERIDLIDHSSWTLFKGKEKQFVAAGLNENLLCEYMQNEPDIWWFETEFIIADQFIIDDDLLVYVRSEASATNVYINDQLIFENGSVANSKEAEKEGVYYKSKQLPLSILNIENNKITLKFSNYHHSNCLDILDVYLTPDSSLEKILNERRFFPSFLSGFFLLVFILNLILFFAYDKEVTFLLLAFFFLFYAIFVMGNSLIVFVFNPKVTYHSALIWISYLSHTISKFLLLSILLFEFKFSKKIKICAIMIAIGYSVIEFLFSIDIAFEYLFMIFFSLVLTTWAWVLNKHGARDITFSLLILFLFTWLNIGGQLSYGYMLGILLFAVVMIFSFVQKIVVQNKEHYELKLRSSVLEKQLIQKHIQPHFLMNSLMSVKELITVNPEEAASMIENLSKEFYLLNSMNDQKLIPLKDEIETCRVHLKIMEAQQKSNFRLKTIGLNGDEMIPPAIFHTLIENGLTHGYSGTEKGCFELKKEENDVMISYRLFNDGKSSSNKKQKNGGTGLKYIKSRLEESYPKKWTIVSRAIINGWETIIKIRKQP